jgi:cytosine/adenosine deaminase-related metal-dependent hydrolase
MQLEGTILRGREFEPVEGRVVVEGGEIAAIEEAPVDGEDVVCPAFVNAHTHLADSIAKEAGEGLTLEELVAPPDGLKHRLLRAASHEEKVTAIERSLSYMQAGGTATCLDFREGGVDGVDELRSAAMGRDLDPVILGRGTVDAMEVADGFGASGANDADFERERIATREAGKLFGIHAGEVDESDLNPALDLDPDFLVHVVYPDPVHLERIEDSGVPIVLCPRSNLVTGVGLPPFSELARRTKLALGTDNVILNSPSMFREMAYTAKLSELSTVEVLRMATVNGAEIAGLECGVIEEGRPAKLFVLDGDSDNLAGYQDPRGAVVRRAGHSDVKRTVLR